MKTKKFSKKLTLNKLTVSSLNDVRGGVEEVQTYPNDCAPTLATCYQYTCDGWTRCPYYAC